MAYQKGVPQEGILDVCAKRYSGTSLNTVKRCFPEDLGRFIEFHNRTRDFNPIAYGDELRRYVARQQRQKKSIDPMMYPRGFPLVNYWTFFRKEDAGRIAAVEFFPHDIVEPRLDAVEMEICNLGYKAFEVYGTARVKSALLGFTGEIADGKNMFFTPRGPNIRGGISPMKNLSDRLMDDIDEGR